MLLLHVPGDVALLKVAVNPEQIVVTPVIAAGRGLTVTVVVAEQPVASVYVITDVPARIPEMIPELMPAEATDVLPLIHVPPPASLNTVDKPAQTEVIPVIGPGRGSTVTVVVMRQPVGSVYVIVDVPAKSPETMPPELTVATEVLLLLQVPPPEISLNAVEDKTQTFVIPVIGAGAGLTETVVTAMHPVARVYVIVDVPPDLPKTIPVPAPIVATDVLLLLQVPPPASLNAVVKPAQTTVVPVIAEGFGFTVTTVVA